jgi:AcrR family transcriptional regulator
MPPRARATAQPAEPTELRATILAASAALIEEEGLAKLSMREVARRAGVTHQAPYHYFADREAILGEIAEQGFRMLSERVERAVELAAGATMPERIGTMGRAYVEFACAHPAHFRIMFRPELVNLDNYPSALAEGANAFALLTRVVHDAVEAGLPGVPSGDALVATLWSTVHGLACLILDGPLAKKMPGAEPSEHIDGVIAALQDMLEATMRRAPG